MVFFWLLLACCSRVSLLLLQSLHAHYNPTYVYILSYLLALFVCPPASE